LEHTVYLAHSVQWCRQMQMWNTSFIKVPIYYIDKHLSGVMPSNVHATFRLRKQHLWNNPETEAVRKYIFSIEESQRSGTCTRIQNNHWYNILSLCLDKCFSKDRAVSKIYLGVTERTDTNYTL